MTSSLLCPLGEWENAGVAMGFSGPAFKLVVIGGLVIFAISFSYYSWSTRFRYLPWIREAVLPPEAATLMRITWIAHNSDLHIFVCPRSIMDSLPVGKANLNSLGVSTTLPRLYLSIPPSAEYEYPVAYKVEWQLISRTLQKSSDRSKTKIPPAIPTLLASSS